MINISQELLHVGFCNYSPVLKKWRLYWIYLVLPSFCHSVILWFCHSVIQSFHNLWNENFSSHFSQELWGLKGWNLVHTWTVGRCIVYTRIGLLLLTHPCISSFVFLSNFITLKCFVTLFSGTVSPRRLNFGTHVDSEQMYSVYWNQVAAAYSSLYFSILLSLQFSNIKNYRHTFLRNCEV